MQNPLRQNRRNFRSLGLILGLALVLPGLGGCSVLEDFGSKKKTPLEGERLSVLELQGQLKPDPSAAEIGAPVIPPAWRNDFWPQSGGYPNHAMQHLALPASLHNVWTIPIGEGAQDDRPLNTTPIVIDGTIYTIDTDSQLRAFGTNDGKQKWQTYIGKADEDEPVIGGGLAFGENTLFATNGFDEILALDYKAGKILWRQKLPAPARAAPTILNNRVYVATVDNRLLALSVSNGSRLWDYQGLTEMTGLVGTGSPAATNDVVIAGFSSGELTALRVENGSVAWTDNLAGLRGMGGLSSLSDIRALPVIEGGLVFAISFGGRMVALDVRTGSRVWQREIGGVNTPWVAGKTLYVVTLENALVALNGADGKVLWVTQLPAFEKPKDREDPIRWSGPVLAGDRLILSGSSGQILQADPRTGVLGDSILQGDASFTQPPIVAGETLYMLDTSGQLRAYR